MTPKKVAVKKSKKADLAKEGTVLFAALRLTDDATDAQYMGNKDGILSSIDLTDKQVNGTKLYLLTPIPGATIEAQAQQPQILALHNYEQARSVAFTFGLYMTGRFDEKKNTEMTVKQALAPFSSEEADTITMRFDQIGVVTIDLNTEGGIAFGPENKALLAQSHVKELNENGDPYPQMIYMAVIPGCSIAHFKAMTKATKYGPLRKRELELMRVAAEAHQEALKEAELKADPEVVDAEIVEPKK